MSECIYSSPVLPAHHKGNCGVKFSSVDVMLGFVSFVKPMQDFRAAVFWAFYYTDMTISSRSCRDGLKTAEGS